MSSNRHSWIACNASCWSGEVIFASRRGHLRVAGARGSRFSRSAIPALQPAMSRCAERQAREFRSEYLRQLYFHLNYLAEHVAQADENPPVGILLCAGQEAEIVRFSNAKQRPWPGLPLPARASGVTQLRQWLHEERDGSCWAPESPLWHQRRRWANLPGKGKSN